MSDEAKLTEKAGLRKRCWWHDWKTVGFIGVADLSIHERCAKCSKERVVQVSP